MRSEETRVEKKGIFLLRVLHARIWTLVSTTLLEKDQFILKKLKQLQGVRGREGEMVDALAFKTRLINQRLFNFSEPLIIIRLSYFD